MNLSLLDQPILRKGAKWLSKFNPNKDRLIKVNGYKLYANTWDRILALKLWGMDNSEFHLLKDLVRDGMTAIDIGANIGFYTIRLSKLVGDTGKVFAFEPEPKNYELLIKNLELNGCKNVYAFKYAVADKVGTAKLYLCNEHRGDHRLFDSLDDRKYIEVDTISLDEFIPEKKIDFIKMDIQGSEYLALVGMDGIIKHNPQLKILAEYSPELLKLSGYSGQAFLLRINSRSLKVKWINKNTLLLE